MPVGMPSQRLNPVRVSRESTEEPPSLNFPNADDLVFSRRSKATAVGAKNQCADGTRAAGELTDEPAAGHLPDAHATIVVAARHETSRPLTKRQRSDPR